MDGHNSRQQQATEPPSSKLARTVAAVAAAQDGESPQLPGQLDPELTLAKRLPRPGITLHPSVQHQGRRALASADVVFRPKTYTVRVATGNSLEHCDVGHHPSPVGPRFAFRLLFDRPPYPPRSQWRGAWGAPDGGQVWDHAEFVSGASSELARELTAMNDVPTESKTPLNLSMALASSQYRRI
ncbi:hypothetical protein SLS62_007139 [Diatrype stigma]|uniref:Uncharacterized protein n=1 Tax=Diatrype stigma TaxID=117547 RepID=A0AAN9YNJ6_9PEZI